MPGMLSEEIEYLLNAAFLAPKKNGASIRPRERGFCQHYSNRTASSAIRFLPHSRRLTIRPLHSSEYLILSGGRSLSSGATRNPNDMLRERPSTPKKATRFLASLP